jgi:hypothetical protein
MIIDVIAITSAAYTVVEDGHNDLITLTGDLHFELETLEQSLVPFVTQSDRLGILSQR